eukprot:SAG11_NODE_26840_length_340_cov_0.647303_1_plen_48_part_01
MKGEFIAWTMGNACQAGAEVGCESPQMEQAESTDDAMGSTSLQRTVTA